MTAALKAIPTALPEVLILEPVVRADPRGFFVESFNERAFAATTGSRARFVQDNHSRSNRNVLRGIHYQLPKPQAKLVRVTRGAVFDVAVDLRRSSPNFGQWVGVELSEDNHRQLWVPVGFGHGFLALTPQTDLMYKVTDFYAAECNRAIRWDDPDLAIGWPLGGADALVSATDEAAPAFKDAALFD